LSGVRPRQFAKKLAEAPTFFFTIDILTYVNLYCPENAKRELRTHGNAAFLTAVMVALLLPQISLSLFGGWLNGRYDARVASPWPTVTQDRDETASVPDGARSEV
jgi:hypothetical protein